MSRQEFNGIVERVYIDIYLSCGWQWCWWGDGEVDTIMISAI